jgi:magnesium transporter
MLSAYPQKNSGSSGVTATDLAEAQWIDLMEPSRDEILMVEKALGLEMPTRSEMQEIEVSSRLYQENGSLFMTATIMHNAASQFPETSAITFVLAKSTLLTIRYSDPTPFRTFSGKADRVAQSHNHRDRYFSGLMDEIIDRLADILEAVGNELEGISRRIFRGKNGPQPEAGEKVDYTAMLERIGRSGELAAKTRESLVSLMRVANFYTEAQRTGITVEHDEHWRTIRNDLASLSEHSTFLSSKTNFLLDATLGMVNIEQNTIIKIFSVAAVVFLPPTLVASVYGMNFVHMPERDWRFGYPLAIVLMILSAMMPWWYFKRRGWL